MSATSHYISLGDPGIEQTLRVMRRHALAASRSPVVIDWAQGIVRRLPERDTDAEAGAFLSWVRANFRYTRDPVDVELVKTPERSIREWLKHGIITGDCDDQATLIAAGMNIVGVQTRFITVAADGAHADFSHVLLEYESPVRGWVSMDPIVRGTGLGWFPPAYNRVGRLGSHLSGGAAVPTVAGRGHSAGVVAVIFGLWVLSRRSR